MFACSSSISLVRRVPWCVLKHFCGFSSEEFVIFQDLGIPFPLRGTAGMCVCLSSHITHICVWVGKIPVFVNVCVCVCPNIDTPHMPLMHLKQAAFAYLKSPEVCLQPNCCNTHTHTHIRSEFSSLHWRLPSQFREGLAQKSADVFTLGGANIVVSESIWSGPECEKHRQLGVCSWLCITWTLLLSWPQNQPALSDWSIIVPLFPS